MAIPTPKAKKIDSTLSNLTGNSREDFIRANRCVVCTQPATDFADELSTNEYTISGLCQVCQDRVWPRDTPEEAAR